MRKILPLGAALLMVAPTFVQPAEAQNWRNDGRSDFRDNNRWDNNRWNNNRWNDNRWNNNRWNDNRFDRSFNINRVQSRLHNRLTQGLRQGNLTQREYRNLLNRYNEIASLEARLRVGGLSWQERARLQNRLINLNNAINRNFYDRQFAGNNWWWY